MLIKIQNDSLIQITTIPTKYTFIDVPVTYTKQEVNEDGKTETITVETTQDIVSYNPTVDTFKTYGFEEYPELEQEEYVTRQYVLVDGKIEVKEDRVSDEEIARIEAEELAKKEAEEKARLEAEELAKKEAEERAEQARLNAIEARKEYFANNFFKSEVLGAYIRKQVTMADNSTKSFLYDLLPAISLGVQSGLEVSIITYKEPETYEEDVDYVTLQETKIANAQFIQECMAEISKEFTDKGGEE